MEQVATAIGIYPLTANGAKDSAAEYRRKIVNRNS
jgi:hypothetical protein